MNTLQCGASWHSDKHGSSNDPASATAVGLQATPCTPKDRLTNDFQALQYSPHVRCLVDGFFHAIAPLHSNRCHMPVLAWLTVPGREWHDWCAVLESALFLEDFASCAHLADLLYMFWDEVVQMLISSSIVLAAWQLGDILFDT